MNCPFYGFAMFQKGMITGAVPFILLGTDGNQCGLVTSSHAPCYMEINGETPDWRACPLVGDVRVGAK